MYKVGPTAFTDIALELLNCVIAILQPAQDFQHAPTPKNFPSTTHHPTKLAFQCGEFGFIVIVAELILNDYVLLCLEIIFIVAFYQATLLGGNKRKI